MEKKIADLNIAKELGLTEEEYNQINKLLKREPNHIELGLFSAMWSEHCSYKNSKRVLKNLPKEGNKVFVGSGENSGAVSISDDYAIVFKVESHNHPSAVEPYEASATGGGGCIRDIFTMGAKPLFLLSLLRFGALDNKQTKFLFKEVARGFTDYANVVGLPALAGETLFDESYAGNPLVNAMVVGFLNKKNLVKARADGVGNLVLIIGGATGRDGVEGASFASAGLDESAEAKSGAVAIGDPKMGKRLREVCLQIIDKDLVVGMQDMGAAGLVCSTSETAYKAGTGIEIDVDLVPRKEKAMTPYEVMLSESQERMLFIIKPDDLDEVERVLKEYDVDFSVIGKVTSDKLLRIKDKGELVAEVPAEFLADGPEYTRESSSPKYLSQSQSLSLEEIPQEFDYNQKLSQLLRSPSIASKEYIAKKVNSDLLKNSCVSAGGNVGVYFIEEINKAVAAVASGNGLYCYLDPYLGAKIAVAEAARSLVCYGAEPLGITDGLNFGNPFNPEVYWQFEKVVEGIIESAKMLNTPVVSGNVSFNNENPKGAIFPTPIIGMVGSIENVEDVISLDFKQEGDLIFLLGKTLEELGGSQYLKVVHNIEKGKIPSLDLGQEKKLQKVVLTIIREGLVSSAHLCARGGLAVSLAESCILGQKGASVDIPGQIRKDALLFGETQSRIVISAKPENKEKIEQFCKDSNIDYSLIGKVEGNSLKINDLIKADVEELGKIYKQTISQMVGT